MVRGQGDAWSNWTREMGKARGWTLMVDVNEVNGDVVSNHFI